MASLAIRKTPDLEREAPHSHCRFFLQGRSPHRWRAERAGQSQFTVQFKPVRAVVEASVSTKRGRYRQRRRCGCSADVSQEQTHKRGSHGGVLWLPGVADGRLLALLPRIVLKLPLASSVRAAGIFPFVRIRPHKGRPVDSKYSSISILKSFSDTRTWS